MSVKPCEDCTGAHFAKTPEDAGMIPRAIEMIFAVSSQLKDRGWTYHMEGQFLEVYNEVVSGRN